MITLWDGQTIPRLGMGCWAIGGEFWAGDQALGWGAVDDDQSVTAIHRAVDLGVRLFDTADVYGAGHGEEVLGRALRDVGGDVVVTTKLGNTFDPVSKQMTGVADSRAYVRAAVEGSLRRLGRERLDLVFFHVNGHPVDRTEPVFAALGELRGEGKVGAFGWSTDSADDAAAFVDLPGFDAVQYDFNLFTPASAMRELVEDKRLVGFARQPLAMGLLTGKFRAGARPFGPGDIRASGPDWQTYFIDGEPNSDLLGRLEGVRELLSTGGRTVVQGALGWIWAKSARCIPIPGFKTQGQVEENAGALEKGALPDAVVAEIDALLGVS